jgi:replicative DNA helicase Mcm
MATTAGADDANGIVDAFLRFYRNYYRDEIGKLAQQYPNDQKSLAVDWHDIYRFDPDLADDVLDKPEQVLRMMEDALSRYDIPIDIDLSGANVRVHNLDDSYTYYPNGFSPTEQSGYYRTVQGDVLVSTDTYSKVEEAAFECQRCGTLTRIMQESGNWQEPHECQGCERQGPFEINYEQSEFIDGETFQLQTPPEKSAGMGRTLQVFVEDDAVDQVEMGDRVRVSGVVRLNQKEASGQKTVEFEPYLDGLHIEVDETTQSDVDVSKEMKERIEALAAGEEGDPLTVAAESFAPEVYGHAIEKKALVLAIIGGATNTPDIRGKFHVLLIGDPSTSKSILTGRVKDIAIRSLAVSGQQSSSAGLTSTATQGEFSDGRWTLSPGAFVKANEGVVVIDELDDMDPDDRKSMLEPMANQEINVTKAGINATLKTQTAVTAAANPEKSRFDPYEPLTQQFGFESNLLSRFDLVFTFRDVPDEDNDTEVADHMTQYRDAKIRQERGDDLSVAKADIVEKPVDDGTLSMWLALAKRRPDPVYESDDVRETLRDSFVTLRGSNGYDEDSAVPVTFRKLPGVERIARAFAKLEFSTVITDRHAKQAISMVGTSMQDYQTDEEGTLDANISESGKSKSQRDRMDDVATAMQELQRERDDGNAPAEKIVERLNDTYERQKIEKAIEDFKRKGAAYEPEKDHLRFVGR